MGSKVRATLTPIQVMGSGLQQGRIELKLTWNTRSTQPEMDATFWENHIGNFTHQVPIGL